MSNKIYAEPTTIDGRYFVTVIHSLPVGHDKAITQCPDVVKHEWVMLMNAYTANMRVWIDAPNEAAANHILHLIFEDMAYPTEEKHGSQWEWEALVSNLDLGDDQK